MSRKTNFSKWILGVTLLALTFIGIWAAASTPSTSAKKINDTTSSALPRKVVTSSPGKAAPNLYEPVAIATPIPVGNIFELDKNAVDDARSEERRVGKECRSRWS